MVAAMGSRKAISVKVTGQAADSPGMSAGGRGCRYSVKGRSRPALPSASRRFLGVDTRPSALLGDLGLLTGDSDTLALRRLHLDLAQHQHDLFRARPLSSLHLQLLRSRPILSISPVQSQPVRSASSSRFPLPRRERGPSPVQERSQEKSDIGRRPVLHYMHRLSMCGAGRPHRIAICRCARACSTSGCC